MQEIVNLNREIEVKTIFHISDIHIKLYKRKDEYISVFKTLCEEIYKNADENSIVIIAGDLFHNKIDLSPEAIKLASDLITNLSKIPVIIIPGNHDANLNNLNRLDSITPIIDNINNKNVYYLKNTGLYKFGNIVFSVMSVFDTSENYILAEDIDSGCIKIALYHGTIDNVKTELGFTLSNPKIGLKFFDGYDICILGDIHKLSQPLLQEYSKKNKKPAIGYSSSCIAQNYGEDPYLHGMLVWDVEKRNAKFKRIKNDYGFLTLDIKDDKLLIDIDKIEFFKYSRIRLRIINSQPSIIKDIINLLKSKTNAIEIIINKLNPDIDEAKKTSKINFENIRDINYQNKLLSDFVVKKYSCTDDTIDNIIKINTECNSLLYKEEVARNIIWVPKKFEFSNMFSYGENNIIDFQKLNGNVGIFGANASGKSSLFSSLAFCIFDTCDRTSKAAEILNNKSDKFHCKFNFEIDNVDYYIERSGQKNKSGFVAVKTDFWMEKDGQIISLNGSQRRETSANIRNVIGTFEDFVYTVFSVQNNYSNFLNMGQASRKDLFAKFLDLIIFDDLEIIATQKYKNIQSELKEFEGNNYIESLDLLNQNIKDYKELLNDKLKQKNDNTDNQKKINNEIIENTKLLVKIDKELLEIDQEDLINKNIKIDDLIIEKTNKVNGILNEVKNLKIKHNDLSIKIKNYNIENVQSNYAKLLEYENKRNSLNNDKERFQLIIKSKLEKTKKLTELQYDPQCKFCMDNIFVKDAIQAKLEIEEDKNKANKMLLEFKEINKSIDEYLKFRELNLDYENTKNTIKDIESKIMIKKIDSQSLINELSNLKNNKEKIEDILIKIQNHKEELVLNRNIELKISNYKNELIILEKDYKIIDLEYQKLNFELSRSIAEKNNVLLLIDKEKKLLDDLEAYKYYLEAIGRNGISYELISKTIIAVEEEINNILLQIVDFTITLEMDNKNIDININYSDNNKWPLDNASGMEKFIGSLAIRIALLNLSNLPKSNFMILDEGFGNLSQENLNNIVMLFDYLKTQFKTTFIISHLDAIRDMIDTSFDIKFDKGYSKINI